MKNPYFQFFLLTAKQHINEADSPTKPFPYRSSLFITNSTGLQILVVLDSFGFCPADGQNLRLDDCVICVKHQGSRSCPILALIHIKLVSPAAKQSTFVYPSRLASFRLPPEADHRHIRGCNFVLLLTSLLRLSTGQ